MALNSTLQDQWAGMYRGKRAPANAAFDLVNLLIDDENNAFKRGGSAYYSVSDAATSLTWLQTAYAPAVKANRVLAGGDDIYVLDGGLAPLLTIPAHQARSRMAGVGDFILFVTYNGVGLEIVFYAGSLKTSNYSAGTITYTAGSNQIGGSGTSWLANADAGMIFSGSFVELPVVKSVDSDTQITLTRPLLSSGSGVYQLLPATGVDLSAIDAPDATQAFVTTAGQRLLIAVGNRVYYSPRNDPLGFTADSYHEVPASVSCVGIEGRDDNASVFTTGGVWEITNLSLDDVDDFGNIQQTVQRATKDLVLWDDNGIAGLSGYLVTPGLDDVYLFSPGSDPKPITGGRGSQYDGGIRALYRSYVAAGYRPGIASVHRSHYVLPILNGSTLVDVLVCRLDHGFSWSRWAGGAAGLAYAELPATDTTPPKLLGLADQRVTDLTGCFDPTALNVTDADGTAPVVQIATRDYPIGQQPGFVTKVRGRYELEAEAGILGKPWRADPWNQLVPGLDNLGNVIAGVIGQNTLRSWLTAPALPLPLSVRFTLISRPASNIDSNSYVSLGATDGAGNGYEARFRFETAADTVTVERWDNGSRTRILGPTALGGRLLFGDILDFRVAADGTMGGYVNGVAPDAVVDTTYFQGQPGYAAAGIVDVVAGARSDILLQTINLPTPVGVPVTVEFSSDADAGAWTELEDTGEQNGGYGWSLSDGSLYQWATVAKRRERIRFRFTVVGACTSFVWRSLEMLTRPQGRQ